MFEGENLYGYDTKVTQTNIVCCWRMNVFEPVELEISGSLTRRPRIRNPRTGSVSYQMDS